MDNKRYYVDDEDSVFYVFDSHQSPHKAVSSWSDQFEANKDCGQRNGDNSEEDFDF